MRLADYIAKTFLWSVDDRVGRISLNRPEKKNPLTFESYAELVTLFRRLDEADDVRAVVITGEGGNFCSGGDVHEIIGPLTQRDTAGKLEFTRMTGELIKGIRACPQPVIAAVDGICVGAGAAIAMAADFRLGTPAARVAFLFVRVGLAGCDMGACAMLPRIIGQGRAAELLFTGRTMSAEEAERWGFFSRLCPPESLIEEAIALARDLAEGPTKAHALTKRMLNEEWDMDLFEAIDAEAVAQAECMLTRDFERAYRAFAAKEKPAFQGD